MRVLAVGCHPDDIEICCAGTLAKCVKRGDTVIACHVSNGDLGHVEIQPKELGEIRCKEAKKAGSLAGIEVICAGFTDLNIYEANKEARDRMVDIIRYANPDFIITHAPDDYMPDHTAVSRLVFDASFAASVPHYETKEKTITKVVPIYYMENSGGINFIPDVYVDITDEIDLKIKMLECHESQLVWLKDHDNIDAVEKTKIRSKFYGYQCGVECAEVFKLCRADLKLTTKRLLP